jgi:hypothetical protein
LEDALKNRDIFGAFRRTSGYGQRAEEEENVQSEKQCAPLMKGIVIKHIWLSKEFWYIYTMILK